VSSQVLGTPTREQIREMNPNYTEFKFPQIKAHPWTKVSQQVQEPFFTILKSVAYIWVCLFLSVCVSRLHISLMHQWTQCVLEMLNTPTVTSPRGKQRNSSIRTNPHIRARSRICRLNSMCRTPNVPHHIGGKRDSWSKFSAYCAPHRLQPFSVSTSEGLAKYPTLQICTHRRVTCWPHRSRR
jgi:hypothetical protein